MRIKTVKPKKDRKIRSERAKRRFPFKAIPFLLLTAAAAAVLIWALPLLPQKPATVAPQGYKGIVEMWNVETFEGGSGSRENWLTARASKFEAKNKGLFVHVTTLSVDQLKQKLEDSQTFDLICFSRGTGYLIKDKLAELDTDLSGVKENFAVSAQLNGKQVSVPLYAGAYCLFARASQLEEEQLLASALSAKYTRKVGKNTFELQPMICGFTEFNSPLSALAMSGGKGKASLDENVSQYQAYEQFVANKTAVTLLGTQRDLYRLGKKESDGKMEQLGFCALSGYTDLAQYVGVSASAGDKTDACKDFAEYLLGRESQESLVNLSLFSVLTDEFYTTERYSACERAIASAYVPNAFGDAATVENQRKTAKATLAL